MKTVACIQARMGSSRLPGKVMLPLDGNHVIEHVIRRVASSDSIDEIVVATSDKKRDDIINLYADRSGATVFRGSEENVLERMFDAANESSADIVVRVTADCPLVSPRFIDTAVDKLSDGYEYVSARSEQTFPHGLRVGAFTFDSFRTVKEESTESRHREHVTPYYYENPDKFNLYDILSDEVFDYENLQNRTDLRLTLDESNDYELLRRIYDEVDYDRIIDLLDAVRYIDKNDLSEINQHVEQKKI
ncbi:cytidylyltransferase domain-containing protein [Halobellus litoreus]|uniref:Cytidylyltransferase domain-containing protein n=1 Tax=Halobellus litoreus TaxID=755310 RepID=A0ABD6DVI6_9EURY|nr:glycosyltransferase family protein [Halobellus litoreus]